MVSEMQNIWKAMKIYKTKKQVVTHKSFILQTSLFVYIHIIDDLQSV